MSDYEVTTIVPRYAPRIKATPIPEASPFDLPTKCLTINVFWLSHILGVMEALDQPDTWIGDAAQIQAARDAVNEIMAAWADECGNCDTPTGDPPFRVRGDGTIEELRGGEWVEPEGDYEIPPVPAREELTEDERKCLAAKNAANVLAEIYEAVTDQYTEEVDPALGILAILGAIGILFAFPFAPIVGSILLFLEVPFLIFYATIEAVGSDFWDADFTDKLVCVLLRNATDAAGVVTFDFEAIISELAAGTNLFDPTVTELRLFGQVDFMLRSLGADGLNHAGTTTAISDADCSACDVGWERRFDFTESDCGFTADTYGTYVAGEGWMLTPDPSAILISKEFDFPADIDRFIVETSNFGVSAGVQLAFKNDPTFVALTITRTLPVGDDTRDLFEGGSAALVPNIGWNANADTGATCYLRAITVGNATGMCPIGDGCD